MHNVDLNMDKIYTIPTTVQSLCYMHNVDLNNDNASILNSISSHYAICIMWI